MNHDNGLHDSSQRREGRLNTVLVLSELGSTRFHLTCDPFTCFDGTATAVAERAEWAVKRSVARMRNAMLHRGFNTWRAGALRVEAEFRAVCTMQRTMARWQRQAVFCAFYRWTAACAELRNVEYLVSLLFYVMTAAVPTPANQLQF